MISLRARRRIQRKEQRSNREKNLRKKRISCSKEERIMSRV